MNSLLYPQSVEGIGAWCAAHGATLEEGRDRFAQFVVLDGIGGATLGASLYFKGGNALGFIYRSPRSTDDLDFSASPGFPDNKDQIRELLSSAVASAAEQFGIKTSVKSVKRKPPGPDKSFLTYEAKIGYALPTDRYFAKFGLQSTTDSPFVAVEISLNEVICETRKYQLSAGRAVMIRACTLEDILAEKLRALLQQRTRNRYREQDVYDIARSVREYGGELDRTKVGNFFQRKCEARNIQPRKSAFDDEIRRRAEAEYHNLFVAVDPAAIPFDEAWMEVLKLVESLDIDP